MKETKFTNGEWELTLSGGKSSVWCGEYQITREIFFSFPLSKDKDEQLANAHLTKTAPKLYEALDKIVEMQERNYGYGMKTHIELIELAKEAKTLLAEARGE